MSEQDDNITEESIKEELDELGSDLKSLRQRASDSADKFEKEYEKLEAEFDEYENKFRIKKIIYIIIGIILGIIMSFIND